jgi:glycosyltransferase involved in cell wall biosynthesis
MKILVLNNMVPFLRGGAEKLALNLVRNLRRYGHDAELLRIPFRWEPAACLYDEMLACRMLRLYNVDRVIGLKFPAYLIPHPHKTLWLIHQYRQAYDLAYSPMSNLPQNEAGENLRQTILAADRECFAQTDDIFVISQVVQQRLAKFNDHDGKVLHPPLDDPELFAPEGEDNYIFCGGRINSAKRQELLVQAMRHVRSKVRLLIAGPPDSDADGDRLRGLITKYRLQDRVELKLDFHPREQLAQWVNRSLACAYVPFDEDYGYVTLEAFYAGKPVITTEDSGGVLDFVRDGATGRVTAPDATSLAAAIDEMATNPQSRRRWGEAARSHIHERNINWPETVKRLVA